MLKRLTIFAGVALIAAVIFVARYDEKYDTASEGYDVKCEQPSQPSGATASLICKIRAGQNADQGKSSPPWWHKLLAWPEGITAWLLVLTLGAITWQAWETRRTADISERVLVSTFRPKVVVRNITLHPKSTAERPAMTVAPPWIIRVVVRNSGGTATSILPSKIEISWLKLPATIEPIKTEKVASFILQPGEERPISIPVIDDMSGGAGIGVQLAFVEIAVSGGREQGGFLLCSGAITYIDDNGIKREMGFERGYHVESKTFLPSKDTDKEYSD